MTKKRVPFKEVLWQTHEWMHDLNAFEIYLMGEVRAWEKSSSDFEPGVEFQMGNRLIKNLRLFANLDPTIPILIHMKSEGGCYLEGMAMFDAIIACPNKVTILDYCQAMSMTSIIFQAADKRVMMPHSYFMFHEGEDGYQGTDKQFQTYAKFVEKQKPHMLDIYACALKKRGKKFARTSPSKIKEILQKKMDGTEEVYLLSKQAVEWGFADYIFDGNWENLIKYSVKNKVAMSRFVEELKKKI